MNVTWPACSRHWPRVVRRIGFLLQARDHCFVLPQLPRGVYLRCNRRAFFESRFDAGTRWDCRLLLNLS